MAPALKVCGLTRHADARRACLAGAAYLGVVLAPGGRRSLTPAAAAAVLDGLAARRVGVFVDATLPELRDAAALARLDVLQLHGDEPPELLRALRAAGGWTLWKALRPRSADEFLQAVERYAGVADALLLDGWSAQARGGVGARFPWAEVAAVRHRLPPGNGLVVAGGLTAENVAEAIGLLAPDAVDVSSGVERAPGVKDAAAIRAFAAAVRDSRR